MEWSAPANPNVLVVATIISSGQQYSVCCGPTKAEDPGVVFTLETSVAKVISMDVEASKVRPEVDRVARGIIERYKSIWSELAKR
jgi:hypothetical protein